MFALISSRMPPRPEMYVLRVDQAALDVFEAADREEVVLLVVVERRLLAQPPEHRVGIGVDLDVVGVVVDVAGARRGHGRLPFMLGSATCSFVEERHDGRRVSGRRVTVTPNGESASATALTTAGGAPIAPPSPTPL